MHCGVLRLMRERAALVSLVVAAAALAFNLRPRSVSPMEADVPRFKDTGGFYVGTQVAAVKGDAIPAEFEQAERKLGAKFRLFPFTQKWAPAEVAPFPRTLLRAARLRGAVPLITWEPSANSFPKLRGDPDLRDDRRVLAAVLNGSFDEFLTSYAEQMRDFGDPVLIRFAPAPDNAAMPWSAANGNTPEDYTEAWDYIVALFNNAGAANVGWVWEAATPDAFSKYFPSASSVDWVGVSLLNRGTLGGGKWREFSEMYEPFHQRIAPLKLPVLVTNLGSTEAGGDRRAWMHRALSAVALKHQEIRGLMLREEDRGWFADASEPMARVIAEGLAQPELREVPKAAVVATSGIWAEQPRQKVRSPAVRGSFGQYELEVDGAPFYIRGVAYNPGHDWRDGFTPLTRRELEADLTRLRQTGANTIRRYGSNWYDRNLLQVAGEKDLKVLFGFWFEHHIDYRADAGKLADYRAQVESTVQRYRGQHSVLAWSLGNEVWGLLKHHYAQPYLTEVRHAHVDFVEGLARRIHELDPERPVFVAHEHSPQLAGSLVDFARGAPSLDITAVNSYYEQRISQLGQIVPRLDASRPYLVSEFGPDGYWETRPGQRTNYGALLEPSTGEKVRSYERAWTVHTEGHRGANIGGVAYCWRDRFEATATWFGLTDSDGRLKPPGIALQRLWTGHAATDAPQVLSLEGPAGTVLPGSSIQVRAEMQAAATPASYRWRLGSEDFDFEVGSIKPEAGGTQARITMPRRPGTYRVYFAAQNGQSTDEANLPIRVSRDVTGRAAEIPVEWTAYPLLRRLVGP